LALSSSSNSQSNTDRSKEAEDEFVSGDCIGSEEYEDNNGVEQQRNNISHPILMEVKKQKMNSLRSAD